MMNNIMPQPRPETPPIVATYLPKGEAETSFLPDRTALLVIDPVNDFLSEGGAGWELTKTTVKMNDVVGHLKRAIEGARAQGIPVLFGPMAYTQEDYADEQLPVMVSAVGQRLSPSMRMASSWKERKLASSRPRYNGGESYACIHVRKANKSEHEKARHV